MQAVTRKQHAQAPEIGIVASPAKRGRGRLVEAAHALLDLRAGDEGGSLEREAEHLEVGDVESPPEPRPPERRAPAPSRRVAREVRDVALVEGEPAVLRSGLERVEQAPRPAAASRPPPPPRRESRADRPPARWPSAPRSRAPRACGRGGRRARARRTPHLRRRATTPPSSAPRAASGVSSRASASANEALAAAHSPSASRAQPAESGSDAIPSGAFAIVRILAPRPCLVDAASASACTRVGLGAHGMRGMDDSAAAEAALQLAVQLSFLVGHARPGHGDGFYRHRRRVSGRQGPCADTTPPDHGTRGPMSDRAAVVRSPELRRGGM